MEKIFWGIIMLNPLDLNCWSSLRLSLARASTLNLGNQQEDLLPHCIPYSFPSLSICVPDLKSLCRLLLNHFLFVGFIYIVSSRVNLAVKTCHAFAKLCQNYVKPAFSDSLSNLNHSFVAAAASFPLFTLSPLLLFSFGALFGLVWVFY